MTIAFDSAPLRRIMEDAVARQAIVGCVIAISQGDGPPRIEVAGYADREAGRAMAPDAVFRLASLTKAVICVLALSMVERCEIALDDPVTRWLPWFTPALPTGEQPVIRIIDLMTHRCGLGYGFGQAAGAGYDAAGVSDGMDASGLTLEDNMRRLAAMPLFEAPGTVWRYSLGIDLLGLILERAADRSLADLVSERLFRPLGMRDTGFVAASDGELVTPYADGTPAPVRMEQAHSVALGQGLIRFAPARAWDTQAFASGGTGLVGTVRDYIRFLDAVRLGGGAILSEASARQFVTHAVGDAIVGMTGSGMGWGLGVAVMRDPAATNSPLSVGSWLWGGVYGNSYWVDPAADISVVVLTNTAIAGMAGPFPDAVKHAVYAGLGMG